MLNRKLRECVCDISDSNLVVPCGVISLHDNICKYNFAKLDSTLQRYPTRFLKHRSQCSIKVRFDNYALLVFGV